MGSAPRRGADRLVVAGPARRAAARRAPGQPVAAQVLGALRDARRHGLRRVVEACADPGREGALDHAEVAPRLPRAAPRSAGRTPWRRGEEGELVGGLYGVAIGGLFAGESMFHTCPRRLQGRARRASSTCCAPTATRAGCIDVQWRTDHLATLGVIEVPRDDYLAALPEVLSAPLPARWA